MKKFSLYLIVLSFVCQQTLAQDITCGYTSTKPSGSLTTNNKADVNVNCTWFFNLNATKATYKHVVLHFESFNLDDDDVVSIKDGSETTTIFTGKNAVDNFVYITNNLNITLFLICSSASVTGYRVMEAEYNSEACLVKLNQYSGTVLAPVASEAIQETECDYTIQYAKGTFQYVSFSKFDFPDSSLTIRDGSPKTISTLTYTGSAVIPDHISHSKVVSLTMNLKFGKIKPIFEANFVAITDGCSKMVHVNLGDSTLLESPNYPSPYPQLALDCRWIITTDSKSLQVSFSNNFQLTNGEDRLEIRDGSSRTANYLALFTNKTYSPSKQIITSGKSLWVRFSTDAGPTSKGFSGKVSQTNIGGYFKDSGTINLPATKSTTSENNTYLLEVTDDSQVMLSMVEDKTILNPNSKLFIYDGFDASTASLVDVLESTSQFYKVVSPGNKMMVVVSKFTGGNFQANFKGVPSGYNKISSNIVGAHKIDSSMVGNFAWVIKPVMVEEDGAKILLSVTDVNLMGKDTINVFHLVERISPILTYNKENLGVGAIKVPAKKGIRIEVHRSYNFSTLVTVFAASYQLVPDCFQTYDMSDSRKITVTSPNYPSYYPLDVDCIWNVVLPPLKNLHVSFHKLDLGPTHTLNVSYSNQYSAMTWSGNVLPNDTIIKNPKSTNFTFQSSVLNETMRSWFGFKIVLVMLDAGEILTNNTGVIKTPKYPADVHGPSVCIWTINVPWIVPKTSSHRYITFSTSLDPVNSTDFMYYLLDGPSIRSPVMKNVTAKKGGSLKSVMTVVYIKLSAEPKPGFTMTYQVTNCPKSRQCGDGTCIQDGWMCDGIPQCSDMADELNCGSSKGKSEKKVYTGVASYVVAIVTILCFIFGVVVAVFGPVLYRKFKTNEAYSSFSNIPVVTDA